MNKEFFKELDRVKYHFLPDGSIKSTSNEMPKRFLKFVMDTNMSGKYISGWVSKSNTDRQDGSLLGSGAWINKDLIIPFLYGHDYKNPANHLGKLIDHSSSEEGVWINNELHNLSPYSEMIWKMVNEGFINTMSVGYNPEKWTYNESYGMDITKWEYLEGSIVPVPANPQAIIDNTRSYSDYNELQRKYSELSAAVDALKGENMELKMTQFTLLINEGIAKAIKEITNKIKGGN